MKKSLILILFALCVTSGISAQSTKAVNNPVGKWQFEAPYAPEGFNTGTVEVAFAETKYIASMAFDNTDYKLPGEEVKYENDILKFIIYVDGNDVSITLKFDAESKMSGKAVYSEGEIPLTLTRIPKKD